MRARIGFVLLFALGCDSAGGRPPLWELVGAVHHPWLHVTQTGGQTGMRTLSLRLEDGGLAVGRELAAADSGDAGLPADGIVSLEIVEATCTQDELARGRALTSAELVAAYQAASETVDGDERRARFQVVPPMNPTTLTFVARTGAPAAPFADLLSYVAELTARYQS